MPVLVHPQRVRVLCVGGGPVAGRKLKALLAGGADVHVVAPTVTDELAAAAGAGRLRWTRRAYHAADIGDAHLVVAATDRADVNAVVAGDADAAGRLCVRVDDGADGTAALMGAVRREPLILAVATTGAAPGLTRVLRRQLELDYGPEYGVLARLSAELRADPRIARMLADLAPSDRFERWRSLTHPDILDLIRAGRLAEAKEAAFACLSSSSD